MTITIRVHSNQGLNLYGTTVNGDDMEYVKCCNRWFMNDEPVPFNTKIVILWQIGEED